MPRGWLTCPVIGTGAEGDPIRASVIDREPSEGDRLECVIGDGATTCLVAFDVAGPSNFAEHGGEILSYEGELDKAADKVAEATTLEALAQDAKVEEEGSAREVLRRIGQEIEPTFDERNYLGSAPAPPTGSFLEDTMTGGSGSILEHKGEKGAEWSLGKGSENTPQINGSGFAVRAGTGLVQIVYASGIPASADYTVECGIKSETEIGSGRRTGPCARISTTEDTCYQGVWETNKEYSVRKRVAGVDTVLGTVARKGPAGTEDKAILSVVGTAIKLFLNGKEEVSVTDSAISAAGRAGFQVNGTSTASAKVDYIIATDAPKNFSLKLEDSLGLSDSLGKNAVKSQGDSLALSDQVAKAVGHSQVDALALSDSPSKAVGHTQTDNIVLSDSVAKGVTHAEADELPLSDAVAKNVGHAEVDELPLSDSIGKQVGKMVSDAIGLADSLAKSAVKFITDLFGLSDSVKTGRSDRSAHLQLRDQEATAIILSDTPQTFMALRDEAKTNLTPKDGPE